MSQCQGCSPPLGSRMLCIAIPVVQMEKLRDHEEQFASQPLESLTKPKRQPESPTCQGPA